jgi:serine protease Do
VFFLAAWLQTAVVEAQGLPDFSGLVERSAPAVVNISTTQKKTITRGLEIPEIPEDSPLGELFRHFFGEGGNGQGMFNTESLGSGFIISGDGYVLTNYHVVADSDEILVRLSDRREFVADLVGADKRTDVALLRIPSENLPVVSIGRSEDLKVGEWVLAIGSPFGFEHSVTAGIVSAKGRNLPKENYVPFIQTDVAINPGNSGGPLFNLKGDVVGMNSQIFSRTGGFMGLSFAIPIDVAMNIADQLKTHGRVTRGWLGVLIQDVNRELAESFGLKHPRGALVAKVMPDSPASKAGIKVGDVILEFNGKSVKRSSDLPLQVGSSPIGKEARLQILRHGERQQIQVRIETLPGEEELELASRIRVSPADSSRLGIQVGSLGPEQREQLDLEANTGVLVQKVVEGPAKAAGIREDDVILMIDKTPVRGVEQFEELVGELPSDRSVAVLVQRSTGPIFLAMKLGDE